MATVIAVQKPFTCTVRSDASLWHVQMVQLHMPDVSVNYCRSNQTCRTTDRPTDNSRLQYRRIGC